MCDLRIKIVYIDENRVTVQPKAELLQETNRKRARLWKT